MFKRYVKIDGLTPVSINKDYLISNSGNIVSKDGDEVKKDKDQEGFVTVTLHGPDGDCKYRLAWLMVIQFKALHIPVGEYDKVIPFHIDGDKENLHAANIGYRFKDGKLECKKYPGYFHIPTFTSYVINDKGEGFYLRNDSKIKYYVTKPGQKNSKGGYHIAKGAFIPNVYFPLSRHRAVLLVFKGYPDNVDNLVSNHKDGIPGNDTLDNLEWVTRRQNNEHAWDNGLRSQNMPVLTRNVITGEITKYRSISDCAHQLGFPTDETIRQRIIGSPFSKVFSDGLQFKLESDERDWIYPSNPVEAVELAQTQRPVKVRDCLTLAVKEFKQVSDAARETGVKGSTILYRLKEDNRSPLNGYQFMNIDDDREWPEFTKEDYDRSLKPSSFMVVGRNIITGETKTWESVHKTELEFRLNTISLRLRKGDQPLYSNGWMFKYDDHDWIDIGDPEEALYKLQKDIMFRRESDGAIFISNKFKGFADTLGLHYQAAKAAAMTRGKAIYNGYRIRLGLSNDPWPTDNIKFNYKKWLEEHNAEV